MKTPRSLLFFAALAVMFSLASRAPAEEADNNDESAPQKAEESTTATTTSEAGAPAMDEPAPVKRATRGYKQPTPRAQSRNPDNEGGGGGGGGGAVPREQPKAEDEPADAPPAPTGKPAKDTLGCDMPPLHHINVHLMGGNGNRFKVDSTPIVCSTDKGTRHERYCQETMGDDNRGCCPVKPEGHPLRVACELLLLGKDPTDGIAGPHWSYIGSDGGVERHPDNPFLAFAYGKGIVRACSNVSKACGETTFQVPNYGKK